MQQDQVEKLREEVVRPALEDINFAKEELERLQPGLDFFGVTAGVKLVKYRLSRADNFQSPWEQAAAVEEAAAVE